MPTEIPPITFFSVQPEWCVTLSLQQQSVLILASRGPDGVGKSHPCKAVQRAYRATVLVGARVGRLLEYGERCDSFMCLERFGIDGCWNEDVYRFFEDIDDLPHHYLLHLMHATEILGYKHPDIRFRKRWREFYTEFAKNMHLTIETEQEMDERLGDWDRKYW